MILESLFKAFSEQLGEKKLKYLSLLETAEFKDMAQFESMRGKLHGLNEAYEVLRSIYDKSFRVEEHSVELTKDGLKYESEPGLY